MRDVIASPVPTNRSGITTATTPPMGTDPCSPACRQAAIAAPTTKIASATLSRLTVASTIVQCVVAKRS
jgi:hypothetical protein